MLQALRKFSTKLSARERRCRYHTTYPTREGGNCAVMLFPAAVSLVHIFLEVKNVLIVG